MPQNKFCVVILHLKMDDGRIRHRKLFVMLKLQVVKYHTQEVAVVGYLTIFGIKFYRRRYL